MQSPCTTDKLVTSEEIELAMEEFLLRYSMEMLDRYKVSESFRHPQWSRRYKRSARQNDARMVRKRYRTSY